MASYETLESGKVRVYLYVQGRRKTATFPNKKKAQSWAREKEAELSKLDEKYRSNVTMAELFTRYAEEVSPKKKGAQWEKVRLNMLLRFEDLSLTKLCDVKREDIEDWIHLREKEVKASTINRELNLISHCLTQARRWRLMEHNPFKDLERPKNPPPRDRRVLPEEEQELCLALGYREGLTPKSKSQFVAVAFLFALETAMRAGEICQLCEALIDVKSAVAHLPNTKNGLPRQVLLSNRAMALLKLLPKRQGEYEPVFQLEAQLLSTLFRKYCQMTTIKDLTFHDSRHEAITRLAEKIEVLDLARMVGHRDIRQLMTYYNKSAADIAKQLG
ncbi:tyrosine-type recombinase/integrase [Pleionea sp. CnH1-48]|uniref:tyrosine-type recombinase/integrase n=1 Tax=Pleionea sp. CnH1-48 TaxID=2954494 RepID=UPI0020969520|nr:tyrosine-type recombinase/integrase [Pleionea sp. CnH1-48]MCO7225070.1 site-specific integrase [Pleionea sp. CnH1-48]